ncbi:MAG: tetratricopeptide repeat protein [Chloroflexota bacterium]
MIEALLQAERLLLHGQVDQAETIYAGAFAQDPHNAIAVVGLARVALERGDEQLAYSRARDALQIDPQNAAAQRLEARLAEVFAARAEPVPPPAEQPPDQRPSERAFLTRNPTMADHLAADERRLTPRASPPDSRQPEPPQPEETETERKPGLWRRILGE